MTRIPYRLLEEMTTQARDLTLERGNLNVYRALANAENVFTGWMVAGRDALTSPVLPARLHELIVLRVGHLMNSPYEIAQHSPLARAVGLSEQEIAELSHESCCDSATFDAVDRAVLRLTTELLTNHSAAPELVTELRDTIGAEATVEVLMIINRWSGLALMLNALDVDIDAAARISIPKPDEPQSHSTPRSLR